MAVAKCIKLDETANAEQLNTSSYIRAQCDLRGATAKEEITKRTTVHTYSYNAEHSQYKSNSITRYYRDYNAYVATDHNGCLKTYN